MNALQTMASCSEVILDFGHQPVSNRFLDPSESSSPPSFPLLLSVDPSTGLVHLAKPFPVEELRPRYDWLTCFEPEDHLDDLAERLIDLPGVTPDSVFGAYSFKDDSTLRRLEKRGYRNNWRIDPVQDLGIDDVCANVETFQAVFTNEIAHRIATSKGPADVMIVRHVVEHAYELSDFIQAIGSTVKPDGYIVWELPDCERALAKGDYASIWEEHVFYFTEATFKATLRLAGFDIVFFQSVPYPHENSIVAIVKRTTGFHSSTEEDPTEVAREISRAKGFANRFEDRRASVRQKLERAKATRGPIAIFGAGHATVAFVSLMNVADLITCVVDDNPHKKGMLMPSGNLPIVGSDALRSLGIRVCLLGLNPQNQPRVIEKHNQFLESGGVFASIFRGGSLALEQVL